MGASCMIYRVSPRELEVVLDWERAERNGPGASAPNPIRERRFADRTWNVGRPESADPSDGSPLVLDLQRRRSLLALMLSEEYRSDRRIGHTRRPCAPLGRAVFGAESDPYTPPRESILSLNRPDDVAEIAQALSALDPASHAAAFLGSPEGQTLPPGVREHELLAQMIANLATFYSVAEREGQAVSIFAT